MTSFVLEVATLSRSISLPSAYNPGMGKMSFQLQPAQCTKTKFDCFHEPLAAFVDGSEFEMGDFFLMNSHVIDHAVLYFLRLVGHIMKSNQ